MPLIPLWQGWDEGGNGKRHGPSSAETSFPDYRKWVGWLNYQVRWQSPEHTKLLLPTTLYVIANFKVLRLEARQPAMHSTNREVMQLILIFSALTSITALSLFRQHIMVALDFPS